MSDNTVLQELGALLEELRENQISETGQLRLAEILRDSDEARAYYLDYMRLVGILHRFHVEPVEDVEVEFEAETETEAGAEINVEVQVEVELEAGLGDIAGTIAPERPRRHIAGRIFKWSAAAVIVIAATLACFMVHRAREPVAVLAGSVHAQWEQGQETSPGSQLRRGNLHLLAGNAQVMFNDGADVIVYGPAKFDIESPSSLRLTEGRLAARIKHGSAGFTVNTPSATLTDLGTEFGVTVDAAGVTEMHVLQGQVRVKPTNSPETILHANMALTISADGVTTTAATFQPAQFSHTLLRIDLADVVAGGDGTQMHRDAGIDVTTGKVYDKPLQTLAFNADDAFHPVPGRPMIAGVFVPGGKQSVLDPDGHTYSFTTADRKCPHLLWAGPIAFARGPNERPEKPNLLGSIDYGILPHGLLFMHANKGITFDLTKIAATHPGLDIREFHAVCQNTAIQCTYPQFTDKADVLVFADGKLIDHRTLKRRIDPPLNLTTAIPEGAHYLTIAITDGGDGSTGDWVTLGDPEVQ